MTRDRDLLQGPVTDCIDTLHRALAIADPRFAIGLTVNNVDVKEYDAKAWEQAELRAKDGDVFALFLLGCCHVSDEKLISTARRLQDRPDAASLFLGAYGQGDYRFREDHNTMSETFWRHSKGLASRRCLEATRRVRLKS